MKIQVTPRNLAQRRRVLFTMLTALSFRYPPGREPPLIAGLRQSAAAGAGNSVTRARAGLVARVLGAKRN